MLITRTSPLTGIEATLDLPVTQAQLDLWEGGKALIQDVMPELTAPQREFIMTGYTEADWTKMFPPPIVQLLSEAELESLCDTLGCHDGEPFVAGWYFRETAEDAPIGPFPSQEAALAAANGEDDEGPTE